MTRDEYIQRAVVAREKDRTLLASGGHDAPIIEHKSISLAKKFVRSLCFAKPRQDSKPASASTAAGAPLAVSLAFKGCISALRGRLVREKELDHE